MILNLYKNNNLELTVSGILHKDKAIFNNIVYDIKNKILIKDEETYKYSIDFSHNEAIVELKEYGYFLSLNVKIIEIIEQKDKYQIMYQIESEDDVINKIEIFLKPIN